MNFLRRRAALLLPISLSLAACGGGAPSSGVPASTGATGTSTGTATNASALFKITIPNAASTSASGRHADYISTGTASATIALTSVNAAAPPAGFPAVTAALTTGSSNCSGSPLVCSIKVAAPPGADAFTVTLSNSAGAALSTNSETVTIVAGQSTTAQTLVLGGIAATYTLTPATDAATAAHVSSVLGGYAIIGPAPYTFTLTPVDASGAIITGPGTPSATFTSPSSAVVVTAVNASTGTYSLRVAAFSAAPVGLTAHATGSATITIPITTTQELWVSDYGNAYGHIYGTVRASGGLTTIAGDTIALNPGVTGYNYPEGIAFDQTGKLWVSDYYNYTVTSYAPGSSTAITTVTTQHYPTGLATDPAGNIWIANDSVSTQELNPATGTFITNALASISGSFPFVAFNSAGVLFLTSNSGNSTSTVKGYLTTSAIPQSSFMPGISPDGVAIDHEGDVWVCDHTSVTMVARTPAGVTVAGTTLSGLSATTSVAVDGSDNIWVLESGDLKEFTRAGAQIGTTMNGPSGNYAAFAFSP